MSGPGFDGVIGRTVGESEPAWEPVRRPADGSPNVLVIVLDDVGFGQLGCYGGSIRTPVMDSLAAGGVRFTNFHVTPLCSPTRASLLTGRNHHSVGMGFLAGADTGYPAYRGQITPRAATLARMLGDEGYATYAVGKWHLTPAKHLGAAGPFEDWPLGQGFDRYYGFMWGEDDQWTPQIWEDNHHVETQPGPDYHFTDDIVDRAQRYLRDHLSATQDRPFLLYLAFGAGHAPHQAPAEYLDRVRGRFDHGWDVERQRTYERQIALGVIPPTTELAPGDPDVPAWDSLSESERALFARMQEAFAAMMEQTDDAIGRLLAFLEQNGVADDTLVLLMADNGASGEGGRNGFVNEYRYFMNVEEPLQDALDAIDAIGGRDAHNIYPAGWAQAGNAPLRFYKKHTYGGGVRAPLIANWPKGGWDGGGFVRSFQHVIDLVPTVLDLTGVEFRASYSGIEQMPLHGRSMVDALRGGGAEDGSRTQYFEMVGARGIWSDGWKAVTNHSEGDDYESEHWALFHLDEDFSESRDLAASEPELLERMKRLWWSEAERFGVLPLDDRWSSRYVKRGAQAGRTHFRLLPGARLFGSTAPNWYGRPFRISAEMTRSPGDEGVVLAFGRRPAGFALFVQGDRLVFDYNRVGHHQIVESPSGSIPVGRCHVEVLVEQGPDTTSTPVTLRIDGVTVASGVVEVVAGGLGNMSTQVGHSAPSPASRRFTAPFPFTGELGPVEVSFSAVPTLRSASELGGPE